MKSTMSFLIVSDMHMMVGNPEKVEDYFSTII